MRHCGSCNDATLLPGGLSIVNTTAVTSIDGFTNLAVIGRLDTTLDGVEYSVVATGMVCDAAELRRFDDDIYRKSRLSVDGQLAGNIQCSTRVGKHAQFCLRRQQRTSLC